MGILCDYFAAPSDEEAASVVDTGLHVGGSEPRFATVDAKGIDPLVQMGSLEALLTGRSYEEIAAEPSIPLVAIGGDGEQLVQRLRDQLAAALAAASAERLAEVAVPWSRTEEFWGSADPDDLARVLGELADLARWAQVTEQKLYCWTSL